MFCRGRQLISDCSEARRFVSRFAFPLPNLGFSLAGFASFHPALASRLVSVAPWGLLSQGDIRPPLRAPAYLGLSLRLAQTLRPSQAVRAWTFLCPEAAAAWAGGTYFLFSRVVGSYPSSWTGVRAASATTASMGDHALSETRSRTRRAGRMLCLLPREAR